ncbi:MAG: hypothetical protein PHG71_08990, partial [Kiritimatiellae bacterium]|nr:hypothetical protein [Kiritimatiellia bacterium]
CFEVLRFNWVMGNYQLKNMSLYTIICLTGLTSSRVTGSHTFESHQYARGLKALNRTPIHDCVVLFGRRECVRVFYENVAADLAV